MERHEEKMPPYKLFVPTEMFNGHSVGRIKSEVVQEIKIQGNNLFERFQGKTIDLKCFKMFWNVLEHISTSEPAREVMKYNFCLPMIRPNRLGWTSSMTAAKRN